MTQGGLLYLPSKLGCVLARRGGKKQDRARRGIGEQAQCSIRRDEPRDDAVAACPVGRPDLRDHSERERPVIGAEVYD